MSAEQPINFQRALATAVAAAHAAGSVMRKNLLLDKKINSSTQHDIKLDLDVRCQKLIGKILSNAFPGVALLGEEGITGNIMAEHRWVVDPIDGTVNFTYGIPHACVSIALQRREKPVVKKPKNFIKSDGYETMVGVVYDPFCDELWTAIRGTPARLNGKPIQVSDRTQMREAIVAIGFAKSRVSLNHTLPYFNELVRRVRKIRMMGAAALAMTYVASGRFDAYVERGIRLWDIAAGGLIVECAGGEFWHEPVGKNHTYRLIASNGNYRAKLKTIGGIPLAK